MAVGCILTSQSSSKASLRAPSSRLPSLKCQRLVRVSRSRPGLPCLNAVGHFFSTSTGHTEEVAELIQEALGTEVPEDIGDVDISSLSGFDGLVVGAPTWNTGADEQRTGTAWDDVLSGIAGLNLEGKPVAVYGLGDSVGYGDYFCDAMEEIYSNFEKTGAKMVGHWPTDGYQHSESKSVINGKFCGLPLDQDNEDDMTEDRVKSWVAQLKGEGF